MESFQIQICVFFIILSSSLTVNVHRKEEIERDRDKNIADNIKAENSTDSESKSGLVAENENLKNRKNLLQRDLRNEQEARKNLENDPESKSALIAENEDLKNRKTLLQRDLRNEQEARKNLEVQMKQMFNNLRELETVVSNLDIKVSTLDNNLLKLDKEIKACINSSHLSKLNETLQDVRDFTSTESQSIKSEILPRIQQLEDKRVLYQDVVYINKTLENYISDTTALKLQLQEAENKSDVSENAYSQPYIPCERGWFLYGEKCYRFFREKRTWKESSHNCSLEGGHLATISSNELQEFLTVFLVLNEKSGAWIGLNDIEMESNFIWEDGSILSYTKWDHDAPSGLGESKTKEDCVEMIFSFFSRYGPHPLENGVWNDLPCSDKRPYICQVDKYIDPRFCSINDGGGFKYLESCFHVVKTKMPWEEAERHCEENFSGHLVTILDKNVERFLNYILANVSIDIWIGIKLQDKDVQKWTSGWPVPYHKWNRTLDQFTTGTCALRSKERFWTTANCSLEFPFICESAKIKAPVLKKAPEGWRCPDAVSKEWIDLGGESCYIFDKRTHLTWNKANYVCQRKGGTLASIRSNEEATILQLYVTTHSRVFIGFHRMLSNKQRFEWADGSSMEYTNWGPKEPNNFNEECGELYSDNMNWNDIDCSKTVNRIFTCSAKKEGPSSLEKVPEELWCPDLSDEWLNVQGKFCYIFITNKPLRWDEANYECGRKGGSLASIHSEAQINILRPYVKNMGHSLYIGLHRSLENKDVFEWVDGSEMDYQNWQSWEPSKIEDECGEMITGNMKWNDVDCSSSKGYICAAKKV